MITLRSFISQVASACALIPFVPMQLAKKQTLITITGLERGTFQISAEQLKGWIRHRRDANMDCLWRVTHRYGNIHISTRLTERTVDKVACEKNPTLELWEEMSVTMIELSWSAENNTLGAPGVLETDGKWHLLPTNETMLCFNQDE